MSSKKKKASSNKAIKTKSSINENEQDLVAIEERRKELIQTAVFLKKNSTREKEEKKEFEKRLEKLKFDWDIEKEEFENKRKQFRQRQKELEQIEIIHRDEIDSIKEDIKDQLFQQENELTRTKNQCHIELQEAGNQHSNIQKDVWSGVKDYQNRLKEKQISHQNFLVQLRKEHEDRITSSRNDFIFKSTEISRHSDRQIKQMYEEIEEMSKKELKKWENDKEKETQEKIKAQESELEELRHKHNVKLNHMLDAIKKLKNENLEKKKKLRHTEKNRENLELKNKQIVEPLAKAQNDIIELTKSCEEFQKEKQEMCRRKKDFLAIEGDLKDLGWRHEVLFQRYQRMEEERNESRQLFEKLTLELQQMRSFSALMVEKKMSELLVMCNSHISALAPHLFSVTDDSVELLANDEADCKKHTSIIDELKYMSAKIQNHHTRLLGGTEGQTTSKTLIP